MDPSNPISVVLAVRDGEHRGGRIHTYDFEACLGQQAGKSAGTAADVYYGTSADFVDDRQVHVQVAAIGVEIVVDVSQSGLIKDPVGHTGSLAEESRSGTWITARADDVPSAAGPACPLP